MFGPGFYKRQNVERVRYAQIGACVVVAVVCGYLVVTTLLGIKEVREAQQQLRQEQAQAAKLSRETSVLRARAAAAGPQQEGGLDAFAVRLSQWAQVRDIEIESVTPEGDPVPAEVEIDGVSVGTWSSNGARIQGNGDFLAVMAMLGELREPRMPIQLESFQFQSINSGETGAVTFDLQFRVYERESGSG